MPKVKLRFFFNRKLKLTRIEKFLFFVQHFVMDVMFVGCNYHLNQTLMQKVLKIFDYGNSTLKTNAVVVVVVVVVVAVVVVLVVAINSPKSELSKNSSTCIYLLLSLLST